MMIPGYRRDVTQEVPMSRNTICLAATLALSVAPAMASSVSTAWAELPSNNQEECLATGSRAVEGAGFRASISQDRQTIFGWRGEEALTVRCISGRGIAVVFAWVTDQSNDSGQLVDAVTSAFRNPGMARGGGNLQGGNLGPGNLGGGGVLGGGGGGVVKR
jgi:hypothetical protein